MSNDIAIPADTRDPIKFRLRDICKAYGLSVLEQGRGPSVWNAEDEEPYFEVIDGNGRTLVNACSAIEAIDWLVDLDQAGRLPRPEAA